MSKHFIPPIIEQYIETMNDNKTSQHIKDNYAMMLERTRDAINLSLIRYNKNKIIPNSGKQLRK